MKAMVLNAPGSGLSLQSLPTPDPGRGQVRVRVSACGVCRTDLHIVDGELTNPATPLIPGHEIIGYVDAVGDQVQDLDIGDRVGIPWLGHTCGVCGYCRDALENLCDQAAFTGYTIPGGYAQYTLADARYCFPVDIPLSDIDTAPLMCAGLIGYRSYRMAGDGRRLGIYGFGAAAHILTQLAVYQGREVYAFTRPGDTAGQGFARSLGVKQAADAGEPVPELLDAAIIFAPAGELVPMALASVRKGGVVICAGIHMSDIPSFPYQILWGERCVRSVANLTRKDGIEFLQVAAQAGVRTTTVAYPMAEAERALDDLRSGRINGAAVLTVAGH